MGCIAAKEPTTSDSPHCWLGGVPIAHPFTLAALSGYSDLAMRVVCRELGASFTRHEVVLDQFINQGGNGAKSGKHLDPRDRPIACQLMGSEPEAMAAAARTMVDFGYDVIDVNFGCPVKKVLGRCRGGFLLGEPGTAIAIVRAVCAAVDAPVTVKLRRGRDDSQAATEAYWRIVEGCVDAGVCGVAVHGRTVEQRYDGAARWEIIGETKRRYPQLTVFGSGDLFNAEDCLRMLESTGIDGVTIARGAIENPWIFRECLALQRGEPKPPTPSLAEQRRAFDRQYRLCVLQYGAERASRQMRKFGIKRAKLHPRPEAVHAAFVSLSSEMDWQELMDAFYPAEENDA